MLPDVLHVVGARVGDAGLVKPGDHLLGGQGRESLDDDPPQLVPRGIAPEIAGEALLGGKARLPQHDLAEGGPFPLVLKPSSTVLPSPAGTGRRGRWWRGWLRRGPAAVRRRRRSRAGSSSTRPAIPAWRYPGAGRVRSSAAGARPPGCWNRRTSRLRCRRSTAPPWTGEVLGPGDRQEPGLALDQQIVSFAVAIGPVMP